MRLFSAFTLPMGKSPPAWTSDPFRGEPEACEQSDGLEDWWRIGDFSNGDIKGIWELSRFDWVLAFAQQARGGDEAASDRLNEWLTDWAQANPAYRGPNWKCAQEASIRLEHLSIAALILGTEKEISDPLFSLIEAHVRRILPTLSYAQGQDNNHATSEAAAIFAVGAWFNLAGRSGGERLMKKGTALLERTIGRLFEFDGSFSQYSLNYHRLALDTLSLTEIWRRRSGAAPFSARWKQRAAAATRWLFEMVDEQSGDAPNLGANDGANLLPLTDCGYRDFRPSVQLAAALFLDAKAYGDGPWNDQLKWLDIQPPGRVLEHNGISIFNDGGYAVLRQHRTMALLRYPRWRFRPSQADAMHVDLWHNGSNLLRDGGSYSYNTEPEWSEYFTGAPSHNTVQFDGKPQMPRLSRFLLGDWLKTETCRRTACGFEASYRHRSGWTHRREICLGPCLTVIDDVGGFSCEARLRWRLAPGEWKQQGSCVTNGRHRLTVHADVPIEELRITSGWESRNYLEKSALPVLEVVVRHPARITSQYHWNT